MMRLTSLHSWPAFAGVVLIGCSATQGQPAAQEPCVLSSQDSVYARTGAVYPACAVERVAKVKNAPMQRGGGVSVSRTQPGETCLRAEARFVVDENGRPEPGTIRILSSNDDSLAERLRISIPGWSYEPARLNGVPVRQVVTESRAMVQVVTRVVTSSPGAGAPPPVRPSMAGCK